MPASLAQTLTEAREKKGWSLREVAEKIEQMGLGRINYKSIHRAEQGYALDFDEILALAAVYQLDEKIVLESFRFTFGQATVLKELTKAARKNRLDVARRLLDLLDAVAA